MSYEEAIANIIRLMTSFHLDIKALLDDLEGAKCKSVLKNPCQLSLADIEGHMCVCSSKNIDCPFREFGCAQGTLPSDEISGHLLQESRNHSEILIGMEKLKDEERRQLENALKSVIDENKSIKIENKLIKEENESIKQEKEVLSDRVRQLSEKLEREIDEKCQSDERDSTMVTAVTGAVASNRDEIEPVRGDILSDCMKCQMESIQGAVWQFEDWFIDDNIEETEWCWSGYRVSGKFRGGGRPYTYELASWNSVSKKLFSIFLRIWAGPSDHLLQWPFRGSVTVSVAPRDNFKACSRLTRQCEIERSQNHFSFSRPFEFPHAVLKESGVALKYDVDLEYGVYVSCEIVPSDAVSSRVSISLASSD